MIQAIAFYLFATIVIVSAAMTQINSVIPAQAGISCRTGALTNVKTPAFAGATGRVVA